MPSARSPGIFGPHARQYDSAAEIGLGWLLQRPLDAAGQAGAGPGSSAAHDRVANTAMVEDRVELVETVDTDRGVIVSHGLVRGEALLDEPERAAAVRNTELVYQGKCGCGCGTDLYGSKYGAPKKFVDRVHAGRGAYLRRAEAREE